MRLISYAKTWPQYASGSKDITRRFRQMWTDGETYFPKPAPGLTKIWIPSWWNHRKDEPMLKPGEVFEGVEWSPRVGKRNVCRGCGALFTKNIIGSAACDCADAWIEWRAPARGEFSRHLETTIVRLGDGHGCTLCSGTGEIAFGLHRVCPGCGGGGSEEAAREGFPGLSWAAFLKRCFPGVPPDSEVARIEFERIQKCQ